MCVQQRFKGQLNAIHVYKVMIEYVLHLFTYLSN